MGNRLMRFIRFALGKVILSFEQVFPEKEQFTRTPELQSQVDQETKDLVLYQFQTCPFCVKTRRAIKRLGLKIELKDAKQSAIADELVQGGGELQVPCLRIQADSKTEWLYESDDIETYLIRRFHNPAQPEFYP